MLLYLNLDGNIGAAVQHSGNVYVFRSSKNTNCTSTGGVTHSGPTGPGPHYPYSAAVSAVGCQHRPAPTSCCATVTSTRNARELPREGGGGGALLRRRCRLTLARARSRRLKEAGRVRSGVEGRWFWALVAAAS